MITVVPLSSSELTMPVKATPMMMPRICVTQALRAISVDSSSVPTAPNEKATSESPVASAVPNPRRRARVVMPVQFVPTLIAALQDQGAKVRAYDPAGMANARLAKPVTSPTLVIRVMVFLVISRSPLPWVSLWW